MIKETTSNDITTYVLWGRTLDYNYNKDYHVDPINSAYSYCINLYKEVPNDTKPTFWNKRPSKTIMRMIAQFQPLESSILVKDKNEYDYLKHIGEEIGYLEIVKYWTPTKEDKL
jgi:hypothetical protein